LPKIWLRTVFQLTGHGTPSESSGGFSFSRSRKIPSSNLYVNFRHFHEGVPEVEKSPNFLKLRKLKYGRKIVDT